MFTNVSRPSAVDVLRPFAVGDQFYADTTSTLAKRAIGSTNDVLIVSGGVPTWSSTVVIATLSVVDSGFNIIGSVDATKKRNFQVDTQGAGFTFTEDVGAQTASRTATYPVLTGNSIYTLSNATLTSTRVPYATTNGILTDSANMVFDGTKLTVGNLLDSGLTASRLVRTDGSKNLESNAALTNTRVLFVDSNGWPTDSANFTFSTTVCTIANTTSASNATTGAFVVGNGTAATSVAIGAGNAVIGANLTVNSLTSGRIPFASTSGLLIDSSTLTFSASGGGGMNVANASSSFFVQVSGAAGFAKGFVFNTGGVSRWIFQADSTAESGSNAGSPFTLYARTDAGAAIDTPINIIRAAGGLFTISRPLACTDTTDSTSISTGSVVVSGGVGVAKRLTLDGGTGKTIKYVNGTANAAVAVTFGGVGPTGSTAGNQLGWIRIDIGGTDRYIPYW